MIIKIINSNISSDNSMKQIQDDFLTNISHDIKTPNKNKKTQKPNYKYIIIKNISNRKNRKLKSNKNIKKSLNKK
jgi:hypothetical protein